MNKILVFLVLVFSVIVSGCNTSPRHEAPLRILFIGNSYTFLNDMPEMFTDLAESGGHEVNVTTLAKGGYSLADHNQEVATRSILENQSWDYVVLQEKSGIPALVAEREAMMSPYIRQINELIKAKGGETILFMTWAYRDGFLEAGLPDFDTMQDEVAAWYFAIADEHDLLVAPVGVAWQKALEREPNLELWMPDGKHPTPLGSFLAASVFYALIFNESPADLQFSYQGISEDIEIFLVEIATEIVLDVSEE